jgi:hypothetical protein
MISYNIHAAQRAFLRAARRQRIDVGVERSLVHEVLEEAACLIDASIPESFHRRIDARDVARVALALATGTRQGVNHALAELADELGWYPEVS